MHTVDVIVVGAGPVGLTQTLALLKAGFSVALIDKQALDNTPHPNQLLRYSALTRNSAQYLKPLVGQTFLAQQSPIYGMWVWDSTGSGEIFLDSREDGYATMGWICANESLRHALIEQLYVYPSSQFRFYENAPLQFTEYSESRVSLALSDQTQLQAYLLIGAEGAHSWVRNALKVRLLEKAYDHLAIVANIDTALPHQQCAWQSFSPSGPLALLPLSHPHQCSIVWSQQTELAQQWLALSAQAFAEELTAASQGRLGRLTLTSERISFPLVRRHAERYIGTRVALVGDAIHTFHPLAGQGLNMGFQDVEILTKHLTNINLSQSIQLQLRRYERERKLANVRMIAWMEGLFRLFGTSTPLMGMIRNQGMQLTQHSSVFHRIARKILPF